MGEATHKYGFIAEAICFTVIAAVTGLLVSGRYVAGTALLLPVLVLLCLNKRFATLIVRLLLNPVGVILFVMMISLVVGAITGAPPPD